MEIRETRVKIENDESLNSAGTRLKFGVTFTVIHYSSHPSYREDIARARAHTHTHTHTHTQIYITLLQEYPTLFFCEKLMDFNEARLHDATSNLHTHA